MGSSTMFPLNLEISEGSIVGIVGQPGLWCMGSLINWLKSGRIKPAIKGSKGVARIVLLAVPLVVAPELGPELPPALGPAPKLVFDMVKK